MNSEPGNDVIRPVTLLVIEDNDLDVELLKLYVRRCNLDVAVERAHHGEEALALLQNAFNEDHRSDPAASYIALLDLNMPRMNGFELLDEISGMPWFDQLPVYVLTTSDQPADRARASEYGVRDFLPKPVTDQMLKEIISSS